MTDRRRYPYSHHDERFDESLHKCRLFLLRLCYASFTPPFYFFLFLASACEFADIVELLLNAGADPFIKDMEGSLPEEVTESGAISSLLRQYTAPKG